MLQIQSLVTVTGFNAVNSTHLIMCSNIKLAAMGVYPGGGGVGLRSTARVRSPFCQQKVLFLVILWRFLSQETPFHHKLPFSQGDFRSVHYWTSTFKRTFILGLDPSLSKILYTPCQLQIPFMGRTIF